MYLLGFVAAEWRTNSLQGQSIKRLIKKLIDFFPTAEPTIWRYFLLNIKRSTVAAAREIKDWLIPKEKNDIVIPLLR